MNISIKRKTVFTLLMMVLIIGVSIFLIGYSNRLNSVWEGMEETEAPMTMPPIQQDTEAPITMPPIHQDTEAPMNMPPMTNIIQTPSAYQKPSLMETTYNLVTSFFTLSPQ